VLAPALIRHRFTGRGGLADRLLERRLLEDRFGRLAGGRRVAVVHGGPGPGRPPIVIWPRSAVEKSHTFATIRTL
jgi:hypothetical protein